jgi:hypothetical protein
VGRKAMVLVADNTLFESDAGYNDSFVDIINSTADYVHDI